MTDHQQEDATLEGEELIHQLGQSAIPASEMRRTLDLIKEDRLRLSKLRAALALEHWAGRIRCYHTVLIVFVLLPIHIGAKQPCNHIHYHRRI